MNELIIENTNGEVTKTLNFDFYIEKIFGGKYLGIAGNEFILLYDWDGEQLIGKIDVEIQDLYWNEDLLFLKSEKQGFMLKRAIEGFEVEFETNENIYHGIWSNNFFFFEDTSHKFKMFINKKSFTLTQTKSAHIVCEYLKNHDRFFFFDNSTNITSFYFSKQLMAILEEFFIDMENADFE